MSKNNLKVAIVYDRINKWGGAERVLLTLHSMFPDAPLYTSVYDKKNASWANVFPKIYTSFLQKISFANKMHELLAVFMPIAFESFDFNKYDLVISVTSEFAKGIITKPNTYHLCYCLTPTRYLWSGYDEYFKNSILKLISKPFINYLRNWDKVAAQRPDKIIAISTEVRSRIKKYYNRDSEIIFPPTDLDHKNLKTSLSSEALAKLGRAFLLDSNYFLIVSRLVSYKKIDLVIKVFNKLGLPLVIVGTGWQYWKLKLMANKNIKFLKKVSDDELSKLYTNACALVMSQYEDFGLVSIEAQSYGVPVIAYAKGGSLDTVIDGKTGILFKEQNMASFGQAIAKFDKISFNHSYIKNNAKRFNQSKFQQRFQRSLICTYSSRGRGY